jgi:hypothetical protein
MRYVLEKRLVLAALSNGVDHSPEFCGVKEFGIYSTRKGRFNAKRYKNIHPRV